MVKPTDKLKVLGDKEQALAAIGQEAQWLNVETPGKISGYAAAWLVAR